MHGAPSYDVLLEQQNADRFMYINPVFPPI